MKSFWQRRALRVAALAAVLFALAGGIAYATIPDSGGVYTACELTSVGTIRLIDPSLGSKSLLGHCSALETQITWNKTGQTGPQGPAGAQGPAGPQGQPGTSPAVTQLAAGDAHCPSGGAAITDAGGNVAYVCNGSQGAPGKDGQPFSGTFTSPNGEYSLTVADDGIKLSDTNGSSVTFADGSLTGHLANDLQLKAGQSADVQSGLGMSLKAGTNLDLTSSAHTDLQATTASIDAATELSLAGGLVQLGNGGCLPAARVGDFVSGTSLPPGATFVGQIDPPGSTDVCIG
ncbi:MAG TPA: hypothetical protein VFA24_05220 [Gaiellaceae bacterium]|nr:hypothetical protein [Gaiellaceae bacterium]